VKVASSRQPIFIMLAALSAGAAVYHIAGAAGRIPGDDGSLWRHALFVAIDLLGAWYLVRRPIPLLPVFVLLVCQQYLSHGSRALRWWHESERIDIISLGTLLMLTVSLVLLVLDARDRSPRVRSIVCPFPSSRGGANA
jgi:hypothetical protein